MSALRETWLVCKKDLRVELRTKETLVVSLLFAVLVAVLSSMSFYLERKDALAIAPGVIWIAIAFSGVLVVGRVWARERDGDAGRALLMTPVARGAIYAGKTLAATALLMLVELVLILLVALFFHIELVDVAGPLMALVGLGTIGFVVTASLFAAISVRTSLRDLAMSVAVFPLIAPSLLTAVVATRELFAGASLVALMSWIRILTAFDLAFTLVCVILFGWLSED